MQVRWFEYYWSSFLMSFWPALGKNMSFSRPYVVTGREPCAAYAWRCLGNTTTVWVDSAQCKAWFLVCAYPSHFSIPYMFSSVNGSLGGFVSTFI